MMMHLSTESIRERNLYQKIELQASLHKVEKQMV